MGMVILGLGANLGDREQTLRRAVSALREVFSGPVCSPVYESRALLAEGAPEAWDMAFLNMAVRGETALAPSALLARLQAIERSLGRLPRGRWGPREIDIDILAYGSLVVAQEALAIPHRELLARDFALVPLADVAPLWVHPAAQKTARALADGMPTALIKTDRVIA